MSANEKIFLDESGLTRVLGKINSIGGAIIIINTTDTDLYGTEASVSIEGVTHKGTFSNTGKCIIGGIYESGVATVTVTDGIYSSSDSVTISAFKIYNLSMDLGPTYTINITTDEPTLYGKAITLTNGDIEVASEFSNQGTASKGVKATGTWTISSTDGSDDAEYIVTVVSGTSTYNVTLNFLEIVSFSSGTDKQISKMLSAYYSDEISWQDMGWSIGDTRKIHLNQMTAPNPNVSSTWAEQDITLVIVAHEQTDLVTPINGHTKACITVQTRECMNNNTAGYNQAGHIYVNGDSSIDTTFTPWVNLYMRTYLNGTVLNSITYSKTASGTALGSGTSFKSMIKKSKHNRHNTYNGTSVTSPMVEDDLFLPSYAEIFGTAAFTYYVATSPVEGTQFPYYETASNRIKYGNNDGVSNGTAQTWWDGSASSSYASTLGYHWCSVTSGGSADASRGTFALGLVPAFAM